MPVRRIQLLYSDTDDPSDGEPCLRVDTAADAVTAFRPYLDREIVEVFAVLCLSTSHEVLGYHEVSRGSLNAATVHPREVFKPAVLLNAAAIVVAHNHPSGSPNPSPDDRQITERLARAGGLLGIPVLDHLVIGSAHFFSFYESGLLPAEQTGGAA